MAVSENAWEIETIDFAACVLMPDLLNDEDDDDEEYIYRYGEDLPEFPTRDHFDPKDC